MYALNLFLLLFLDTFVSYTYAESASHHFTKRTLWLPDAV